MELVRIGRTPEDLRDAEARVLGRMGVPVHMVEKKEELRDRIGDLAGRLFVGDAANRELLSKPGSRRCRRSC